MNRLLTNLSLITGTVFLAGFLSGCGGGHRFPKVPKPPILKCEAPQVINNGKCISIPDLEDDPVVPNLPVDPTPQDPVPQDPVPQDPVPQDPVPEVSENFSVKVDSAPFSDSVVKGIITLKVSGSKLGNVELLPATGYTPMYGRFTITGGKTATLNFDTTKIPDGPLRVRISAFDTPPGGAGATDTVAASYTWVIANKAAPATPRTLKVDYHGDSTIAGVGGNGTTAPAVFQNHLKNQNPNYIVRNYGVGATDSCELLEGVKQPKGEKFTSRISKSDADIVIFNFAINDQWVMPISKYENCMGTLVSVSQQYGKKVYLETPNPTRDDMTVMLVAMKSVAGRYGVKVIDQYPMLMTWLNGRSITHGMPDGIHPNAEVYTLKGKFAAEFVASDN